MIKLGAVFLPQWAPERLRPVAEAADQAGLDELWLWEDCFWESGIATASAALAWTSRLKVGVGLLPVPLRNVAITAMEIATLHRLFPGRVQVGIGHGVQDWMAQVGAKVDSPVTLLREYLDALKALLRGETVTTHGRYVHLDEVTLVWPPADAPIFVGAVGPRTLRLSGSDAAGTILTGGTTPTRTREARDLIGADDQPVVVYLHAATGPDAAVRLEAERIRWGYDSLDDVAVLGDAATVAAGVRRWAEAGATTIVLQPTPDDPDPEGFMRFVAQDVKALL
ncbi:MAG: LLM class flavin-dependent oxidoreductase [Hamadaea sp.]|nr:LLM class flavin-dependent oxidoreductase [Hamadaea sp.]NUR50272.1 LLM class flavin-dependent oxidoreductase [Hamadaea sp.]NUT08568.1 LLM class flavin-dependent oxidoreductase [Hamadaea sp.]